MKLLVDADLPRSTADVIRSLGHEALDVRDTNLRYSNDSQIIEFAAKNDFIIITKDRDFVDLARVQKHKGIIHVRLPYYFNSEKINYYIQKFLKTVDLTQIMGAISVIRLSKFRIRKF